MRKIKQEIINFLKRNKLLLLVFLMLILLTFLTNYYGSIDTGDYSDTAKFFAGGYSAKIRSSHSYLFGFIHAPLVWLTKSFIGFKITSLIFLIFLIYSVYIINNKNKRALWLMLLSPVVWYMAPWISPIQASSLALLWAWFFINKYDETNKLSSLFYSGILVGLGWAIYDTILYFGIFLAVSFLYNRKSSHFFYFIIFVFVGLIPRLILDNFLFNFPFFTILKSTFAGISNMTGGVYGRTSFHTPKTFVTLFSILLAIPFYFWSLYHPSFFKKNKKTMFFLTLSVLLIFINPQIRYTLIFVPVMIVSVFKKINKKQFIRQIILSVIILFLFTAPYIIQINNSIDKELEGVDFTSVLEKSFVIELNDSFSKKIVQEDLKEIIKDYPNQTFVVGNYPDNYQTLADLYWGSEVNEFVSIEDYGLVLKNETILYEKKFMPVPNIKERRQIWISGGISKNENDKTDYNSITLGIGVRQPINLQNFKFIKKYNTLYLSEKQI